jgi:aldose sugar dehydrogenase
VNGRALPVAVAPPRTITRRAAIAASILCSAWITALAGCNSGGGRGMAPSPVASSGSPTLTVSAFLSNLENPWDMAFTPDGALLFTERCRGLSVRRADGSVERLFGVPGSALMAADMFCEGQSGVHGVAVDPAFSANRSVYVYMASTSSGSRDNRVVRLTVNPTYTGVANRSDIVTGISFKDTAVPGDPGGAGAHSGGRIRFGPDGFLYVTTGDNHRATLPQDLTRLGGKVLRVNGQGGAAPGNNTPLSGDPRIFAYGLRNVQGIDFRPGTGQPFIAEHGPQHTDEVTPLVAGGNGGWHPVCANGVNYCGYAENPRIAMTDLTRFPDAMRPSWTNNGLSQGLGPGAFLTGPQWRTWDGRFAVALMAVRRVDVLQLDGGGMTIGSTTMSLPSRRIRSIVQGPDGNLYMATDEGAGAEIWRVVPN